MADQFNPTLEYLDFPDLAKGMSTEAPTRSLVPENQSAALFRDVTNLSRNRGSLGGWSGIYRMEQFYNSGVTNYPTIERNGSYFETAPDGLLNGQCAMWLFYDFPQTWNKAGSSAQSTFGSFMGIVVTSREIFIYSPQDHIWYNATPVYVGDGAGRTVDVTAGGLVTINTGTSPWNTRKIVPGQLIQFAGDANWYSITSVLTGPDRLQTTFAGVAKNNVAYTIRRCFGGRNYSHGDNLLYGTIFNGDLYIGGRTLAGATVGPAVIRVKNIYDNVYTTEYLLAPYDLTGSMSANGSVLANLWDIKGLQLLPDGRVVVAVSEVPTSKTGIVGNRLRYSSNTAVGSVSAQEVWNASPAGFIDVVDYGGEISALGKLGPSTLTIHFHRGVSLGIYTAQYDPPLSIQSTAAKVGCFAPRTLALSEGKEFFLGVDGLVHAFNGNETTALCDETLDLRHDPGTENNAQSSFAIANTHALIDLRRNYYRLFYCDNNFEDVTLPPAAYANYTTQTTSWLISLDDGAIFKETYVPHITAATNLAVGSKAQTLSLSSVSSGGDFGTIAIGTFTENPADTINFGGAFLYLMSGEFRLDVGDIAECGRKWETYLEAPTVSFETDDLDFGKPGIDKTIDHIILWLSGYPTDLTDVKINNVPVVVSLSPDGGVTWPYSFTNQLYDTGYLTGIDRPWRFDFEPKAAEKWRIKVSRTFTTALEKCFFQANRMRVYYQTGGEIEATDPQLGGYS